MSTDIENAGFEIIQPQFAKLFAAHIEVDYLWRGARWCEGPARFCAGRYLVWSDIPNSGMMRWDQRDWSVSEFRAPFNFYNVTFSDQGRNQLFICASSAVFVFTSGIAWG